MRIKKLELLGFKSFKDRTVIHFDAGITGVVGPNGCGKSNIVDALVWVMGEMSAKHLRGSSMEDVIFAGAEGYAPMGLCEVSLTLENDGGPFPVKYLKHSEIMVTRRLHRGGEGEYLINKESARLKDVQEIFMDTGAGSKGFSIVEQGAIGRIVTAKPEDRRTLIEEAAGITKFKVRKRESQRKLQSTEQNLIRLQDIVVELKRQIDSLQRQAQRAERYRKLKMEIEDLELWISSQQFLELQDRSKEAEIKFNEVNEKLVALQSAVGTDEVDIETLRNELALREAEVQEWQREAQEAQSGVQKRESEIQQLRFDIEQARQKKEMAGNIIEESQARAEVLNRDLERVNGLIDSVREAAESLQEQFKDKKLTFDEITARISEIDSELTNARRELLTVSQAESSLDAKTQGLQEGLESLLQEAAESEELHQELHSQSQNFEKHRRKVSDQYDSERQMHLNIMADVDTLKLQRLAAEESAQEKRKEVESFKDELNKVTSRLYGLENLQDNLEGFQEGVRTVMFWSREKSQHLGGGETTAFKPMAEVVEVPKEFEVAMEAALGPRLQMLLSEQKDQTLEAVDYLKANSKGRSSFFTMDERQPGLALSQDAISGTGFRAKLKDVIRYPEHYESLMTRLLGNVGVVENLESAFELKAQTPEMTFVTLDGDLLSPEGVLTAGSAESADSGVLKRRREIKELSFQKDEWAGKLALATESLRHQEEELKRLTRDLEQIQKQGVEREIVLAGLKKDLERADIEFENAKKVLQKHDREFIELQTKKSKRQEELLAAEARLEELRTQKVDLESSVEGLQLEHLQARNGVGEMQEQVTQLQIESAKKNQEYEGLNREHEMLSRSLEEVRNQLAKMTHESDFSHEVMSGSQLSLQEKQLDLEKQIQKVEQTKKQVAELRDAYEKRQAEVRKIEEDLHHQRRDQNQLQAAFGELKLELEQARMKELYLIDQTRERYMIELPDVAEKYRERERFTKDHEKALKENKEKISKIGDVNLSAIEEFDETSKRYEFLKAQQDDLNEAKEQLRKVIERINRICTRRFKETFDAVNERFTRVFPVLFGGGEARLILIEDPEKGEMGIDIVAKPPGKKSQSVTLLSGGEKALTAVSLIFSIFLVKPSPYCLLDEVDAPLDDANVMRFNDLVKEMAKRSQIILVTHNKYTMQTAHKLYGVTQEEKGVSKMVSVSLGEARAVVG